MLPPKIGYPVIGSGGEFSRANDFLYEGESVLLGRKGTIDKPLYLNGPFWTVDTMFYTELSPQINGRFLYYYATCFTFDQYSTNTALPSMAQEDLANIQLAVPELREQSAIAAFLDHESARIDALIEEQKRLIELLKEKRQALVKHALTSSTSVKWRLENIVDVMSRPVRLNSKALYTPIGLYNRDRGLFHKEEKPMEEMGESSFYWVNGGDLILSGQFAWEGAVALAGSDEHNCVVSHRYPVLRGKEPLLLTEYLYAILATSHGNFLLNENSRGAAGRNRPLNINSLLKEKITIPALEVQDRIASLIRSERRIRSESDMAIKLAKEYRSALISAAVTGKIDVRNWEMRAEAEAESYAMAAEPKAAYEAKSS